MLVDDVCIILFRIFIVFFTFYFFLFIVFVPKEEGRKKDFALMRDGDLFS